MVVSKDTKRRRKEIETPTPSPPPPLPLAATSTTATTTIVSQSAAQSTTAVESSPEMPKRTKVQAQRKFAQGQSAPVTTTSAFSALSISAGPSTSAESREPPIEILPNKRPKTQDFLTFLCFRGTPALPPHLDYLNQGDSKEATETENANSKKVKNSAKKMKLNKKGKRGRPKGITKTKIKNRKDARAVTTTTAEVSAATIDTVDVETAVIEKESNVSFLNDTTKKSLQANSKNSEMPNKLTEKEESTELKQPVVLAGAVRKRAEVLPEGNRRGRRSANNNNQNADNVNQKCNSNNNTESKRRSNRTNTKEERTIIQSDSDDEEDNVEQMEQPVEGKISVHEITSRVAKDDYGDDDDNVEKTAKKIEKSTIKKSVKLPPLAEDERNTETQTKDSEAIKTSKRGRPTAALVTKKSDESIAKVSQKINTNDSVNDKEKLRAPVKRVRQRESPIFIPSPESSGRMTRQRAFFEPVKVPTAAITENDSETEMVRVTKQEVNELTKKNSIKVENEYKMASPKESKTNASIYAKEAKQLLENGENNSKSKTNLNIFDFSSDDEQPLAKTIKMKKGKASPKKQAGPSATPRGRKTAMKKLEDIDKEATPPQQEIRKEHTTKTIAAAKEGELDDEAKTKPKRGRSAKKKSDESSVNNDQDLTPPPVKKSAVQMRQARKSKIEKGSEESVDNKKNAITNAISTATTTAVVRSQRPSRKTKEAAAIYMGIIGHKLQMADDEEDDLSLSSFPDIPNVKEMEKMENEIKKNAGQIQTPVIVKATEAAPSMSSSAVEIAAKFTKVPPKVAAKNSAKDVLKQNVTTEKPPARRGRPPKQGKAAELPPPKREIEGMLVKKGALAKITANVVQNLAKSEQTKQKIVGFGDDTNHMPRTTKLEKTADDEDFLINEELNETKRKLEKSFSDSDDEPLAIKANVKGNEKDIAPEVEASKLEYTPPKQKISNSMLPTTPTTSITQLTMLPLTTKPTPPSTSQTTGTITTAPFLSTTAAVITTPATTTINTTAATTISASNVLTQNPCNNNSISSLTPIAHQTTTTTASYAAQLSTPIGLTGGNSIAAAAALKSIEKKSPVSTSKILNVPATYALPGTGPTMSMGAGAFNKTSPYLPQASPHYHTPYVRPPPTPTHSFSPSTAKSPTTTQSPLKYQTPPTTYPPPIEAYQCPKINPNFLTPKFDRTTLPRSNNFPSPSPVKFDAIRTSVGLTSLTPPVITTLTNTAFTSMTKTTLTGANLITLNATSNNATPSTSAAAAAAAAAATTTVINNNINNNNNSSLGLAGATTTGVGTSAANANNADPLKDEIGSILAANLMPSKEESGKIFGIASVSLAQSSGPDNTKCTLGKCGSIHKPVLGPVVPTEGYFGDQLSSKERRKAKVNMTHEQIQKWLIECSSNPDEIQDDLDDDFEDSLRPNQSTTPPPTRDDKESTSFSSSSKNTRDLGKSESAWSAKGPSLKATPVVANANRKDEDNKLLADGHDLDFEKTLPTQAVNLTHKSTYEASATITTAATIMTTSKEQIDKKVDKKAKDMKTIVAKEKDSNNTDSRQKQHIPIKNATNVATHDDKTIAGVKHAEHGNEIAITKQQRNKKHAEKSSSASTPTTPTSSTAAAVAQKSSTSTTNTTMPKRNPVYNQKTQKRTENKPTAAHATTTTAATAQATTTTTTTTTMATNQKRTTLNDTSVYAFDHKDDETSAAAVTPSNKATNRARQGRNNETSHVVVTAEAPTVSNVLSERSPTKKRAAAAAAATAVSLTLSPTENCKLVKVSLDAGHQRETKITKGTRAAKRAVEVPAVNTSAPPVNSNSNNDADSDADGATFYIPLQGTGVGGSGDGGIQGVAVKLGREGPDGPNQKVVMQATLVTKAQMDTNTKPLPESLNTNELVKTLLNVSNAAASDVTAVSKKSMMNTNATAQTNSASNSLKNVPIGTVQPRFKTSEQQPSTSNAAASNSGLVRVNSCSSLFSGSAKSRNASQQQATNTSALAAAASKKFKDDTPIKMANNTAFPRHDDPTQMVEAPIFRPTEKEFADPIEFIERITPIAARFGICKIIPPATFKPECRISDEMRFTAYNQYVHKMLHRWGPSAKELSAIKKYLTTQSIVMNHPPWIGGMEVDLPRLYHTVQELGGLKEVIEKKKWARVAEEMCIPKLAQDRVTKLDDIYCKYLLPYDTLSPAERQKLFDEVEADWAKREARARRNADRFVNTESVSNEEDDVSTDDDEESEEEIDGVSMECIVKGRSMPLSQFYRIARNTMALWFKNADPTVNEVEAEFWRHVAVRDSHVCVHSGSIDSSGWGYGFPSPGPKGKGSNYARHPWNLKVLTNNTGSVLRSLGPVMGVTVPTLHVGMLFSACCWYRDPHGLSWIEYLHTGASKLWYGIPDDQSANFRSALTSLIPTHCQNKTIWLPCDTVMVPPHMLTDRGVSLCRIEQKPGEFIVIFPRAYTSSVATGYVVSESVYFATMSWLDLAKDDFRDIHESCEPAMFSLEQLLFALGYDQRVNSDTLQQMLPMLNDVCEKETAAREQLKAAGVTSTEKIQNEKANKVKKQQQPPNKSIESECDLCRANLYISMVRTEDGNIYCLQHALKNLNNGNIQAKQCKLIYAYNMDDIQQLIRSLKDKIQQKQRMTVVGKKAK